MNIDELERIANEATDGPWQRRTGEGFSYFIVETAWGGEKRITESKSSLDAAYIEAANPATMRKLIERLRDAEEAMGQGDEAESAYFSKWHGGSE